MKDHVDDFLVGELNAYRVAQDIIATSYTLEEASRRLKGMWCSTRESFDLREALKRLLEEPEEKTVWYKVPTCVKCGKPNDLLDASHLCSKCKKEAEQ